MGELTFFLGLQIKHGIFIYQSKYCTELLKGFCMDSCKESTTPMATNCYLDVDEKGKFIDQTKYRGMIGSLMYLTISRFGIMHDMYLTISRPGIMHNVCVDFNMLLKNLICMLLKGFLNIQKEPKNLNYGILKDL